MLTIVKQNAILEYCMPSESTLWLVVNIFRKDGIRKILPTVNTIAWHIARKSPMVAAVWAFLTSFAPIQIAITALIPIPKPMLTALIKFCTGKTKESAVIASSLIFATKKLSMIL